MILFVIVAMISNLTWFDLAGFIGVLLVIIAYLLLQLDKLPSSSPAIPCRMRLGHC
jgi:hypothetical protein